MVGFGLGGVEGRVRRLDTEGGKLWEECKKRGALCLVRKGDMGDAFHGDEG